MHAAGRHAVVVQPPSVLRLPPENLAGSHDTRSGARSYYDTIEFGEQGHALAVTMIAVPPTPFLW